MPMTQENAFRQLQRLADMKDESAYGSLVNIAQWSQFAIQAIEKGDYQQAKAWLACISYSSKGKG